MAGTAPVSFIASLFAESSLTRLCGLFPTEDFEFVAVGVFKEKRVVSGAVICTNFRAFQISSADLAHELGDLVDFFTRVRPKSDSRAVGLMMSIFRETKKVRRLVAAGRIKRSPFRIGTIGRESEYGPKLLVKLPRAAEVFDGQINVIQSSCFHLKKIPSPGDFVIRPGIATGRSAERIEVRES